MAAFQTGIQEAKQLVLDYNKTLETHTDTNQLIDSLSGLVAESYLWRGMHPFDEKKGVEDVVNRFWKPLQQAIAPFRRRPDIFFAGNNQIDDYQSLWVVEMGHLMGIWKLPWIGLKPSKKLAFLRYCEFHRVEGGRIAETACYVDILNLLAQSGRHPPYGTTGSVILTPGPATHDGLLTTTQADGSEQGRKTVELIYSMVSDLRSKSVSTSEAHLNTFWAQDLCWFGPGGIGANAFYDGYISDHCAPFEKGLEYVRHTEHVARLGEGNYGGFFGYPSLTLKSNGGFMGFPANDIPAEMRIVDLYRRVGDKLAENWIFIDMPHFFKMQGIDILSQIENS